MTVRKIKCDYDGIEITKIDGEYLVTAWAIDKTLGLFKTRESALVCAEYWSSKIL